MKRKILRTVRALALAAAALSLAVPAEIPAESGVFQTGEVEGTVYTSPCLGIRADFKGAWSIYDEEELLELNGAVTEALAGDWAEEQLETGGSYIDFAAGSDLELVEITVSLSGNPGEDLNESMAEDPNENMEEIREKVAPAMEAQLSSQGITDICLVTEAAEFLGKETQTLLITGKSGGINFYERLVYVRSGEYTGTIAAISYMTDSTGDILKKFELIQEGAADGGLED